MSKNRCREIIHKIRFSHIALAIILVTGLILIYATDDSKLEGNILLAAMAPMSWIFVVRYAFTPWRATSAGRSIMYLMLAFSLVITQVMFTVWVPDYWGRDIIRPFGYLAVLLVLANLELTRDVNRRIDKARIAKLQREIDRECPLNKRPDQ